MPIIQPGIEFSPREHEQMQFEERLWDKQAEFNLKIKELELEVARVEAKWNSLFKLPILIIKLPVYVLFGLGYIINSVRNHEPSDKFWDFIRK